MKRLLIIFSIISMCGISQAEEKQSPTDAFRGVTQFQMMMCKIKTQTELNKVEMGESSSAIGGIAACIKDGRAGAKKAYPAALAKISKNPVATKLLKDYYAAWITSLDGVMPQPGETKIHYLQRQESAEAKYDEIWNRLEIEAGL